MSCFRHYSAEVSQVTAASVPGAPSLLWGLIYSLSQQGRTILPRHQVSQSPQLFLRIFVLYNLQFSLHTQTWKELLTWHGELTLCPFCFHSHARSRRSWEVTHMITSAPEHRVYAAVPNPNTALGPRNKVISRSNVIEGPKAVHQSHLKNTDRKVQRRSPEVMLKGLKL